MPESNSPLIEHLLEALSLAMCCEKQDPPNPITLAALQHSIQDLVEEIRTLTGGSVAVSPFTGADIQLSLPLPAPSTL
jgi:hypothetical protein